MMIKNNFINDNNNNNDNIITVLFVILRIRIIMTIYNT